MSDYIKRKEVKWALNGACVVYDLDTINNIPAADVVECSKLLEIADKQEKLGFIQTADVLRRIAGGDVD